MPSQADGLGPLAKSGGPEETGGVSASTDAGAFAYPERSKDRFYEMLAEVVEGELIPNLAQLYDADGLKIEAEPEAEVSAPLSRTDVLYLVDCLLGNETVNPSDVVWRHLSAGCNVEEVYLKLLAPAAKELGDLWLADKCSFYDVTLGASQLQFIMRECASALSPTQDGGDPLNVVLGGAPGEQHLFGISMIEEFFRNRGWNTTSLIGCEDTTVIDVVAHQHMDVIALSCSCSGLVEPLADEINKIKKHSQNKDIIVMVGGYVFQQDSKLVEQVGADHTANDAWRSVKLLDQLDWKNMQRGA